MARGRVLNIQRYSLQDGPGIRTTIFLKGCPAHCWWCHNPESQSPEAELVLFPQRCIRCGTCLEACPHGHPGPPAGEAGQPSQPEETCFPPRHEELCEVCGACVEACPGGAREIAGVEMNVGEVVMEVGRDRVFHDESGGGVTVSGGEPLLQFDFLLDLLTALRTEGFHTAVDTCGFAPRERILAVAPWTDLFLYDLKTADEDLHGQVTGVPLAPILENLRALDRIHSDIWIRIPVVPQVNDDPTAMASLARQVDQLQGIRVVSLLPYHRLGVEKLARLGRKGTAAPEPLAPNRVEELARPFRDLGLEVRIGG